MQKTKNRFQVWSSGGGTQSCAIAALIVLGKMQKPDLAVIIDTERESSGTWEYHDSVIVPALESVGVKLHRVNKSEFATVDLYSENGDLLIPAFTDQNDGVGKMPTFCSNEWKQRAMRRWASTQTNASSFDVWIGISTDEMRRVKQVEGKWKNRYPLIEQRMNRGDCIALVERIGWPTPPRSSCWMCPNKTRHEWQYQKDNFPQDHEKAVKFEQEIRKKDDALWLTQEARPLDEIDFSSMPDMFSGSSACNSGYCFV